MEQIRPIFVATFYVGISFGRAQITTQFAAGLTAAEWDVITSIYVNTYTRLWTQYFTNDTVDAVRKAVLEAFANGGGSRYVFQQIKPLFDKVRAKRIAVTETTRLFGLGAVESYRVAGLVQWEWHTVFDERVCKICGPLHLQRFPISRIWSPAHVTCRCFPAPVPIDDFAPGL